MEPIKPIKPSLFNLLRSFLQDAKILIRQELELAKAELSDKISRFGKNATALAIGALLVHAGLVVLLIFLGCLVGWLVEKSGLEPLASGLVGFGTIAFAVVVAGCVLVLRGYRTISRESLAPQRAIRTLRDLTGGTSDGSTPETEQSEQLSARGDEIQTRVEETGGRLGNTLEEIGRRVSPGNLNAQVKQRIRAHPYRSGLVAVAVGVLSGYLLRRKFRHT